MSYTYATVEGFVTQEPVLRKTKTGKFVCTFSLAIRHYTAKPDENPRVSFIDIETWELLADTCYKKLDKGKRIFVIGSLRQERWDGEDGKIHSRIKVVANHLRFLDNFSNHVDRLATENNLEALKDNSLNVEEEITI